MEINQNQTRMNPVDAKPSGLSALQKVDNNQPKESVAEVAEAKRLQEVKAEREENVVSRAEELKTAVAELNEGVQNIQRNLLFSVDEESGREVVSVLDASSKEVIKQFPTEEALILARSMAEQIDANDKVKMVNLFNSIA